MLTEIAETRTVLYPPAVGMETDRMIAKDVFHWSEEETPVNVFFDPWASLWRPRPKDGKVVTPSWSRSPTDAVKVVERMEEMEFKTEILREGGDWHVTFTAQGLGSAAHYPDFSYAVCLAALGALGVLR